MRIPVLILAISALLLPTPALHAREIHIALTSDNPLKLAATQKAFKNYFPEDDIQVRGYKCDSKIPAQPVSKKAAELGAHNRINALAQEALKNAQFVVSIENYIEQGNGNQWQDIAFILIRNLQTKSELATCSKAVIFDEIYERKAFKHSKERNSFGYSLTVGEVLYQENQASDAHDWHKEKAFGGLSRENLMEEGLFKLLANHEISLLKKHIGLYPNFPKSGILFEDFTPILSHPIAFKTCIELLAKRYQNLKIDMIVGLESRGFILGAALANEIGVGFVPMRKAGKLPGPVYELSYEKEYGKDTFAISKTALLPGQRVLVIDDLIATGGSAKAAIDLVKMAKADVIEFVSLLEVKALEGRSRIGVPSFNLLD